MKILGIETATLRGGVALMSEEGLISEYRMGVEARHSERLLPAINDLLTQTRSSLSQISAIAVSAGPGSYTGLRVGLSVAKGLAMGANLPLVMVPTLEAHAAAFSPCQRLIAPMLDARRSQIYWALFEARPEGLTRVYPDTVSTLNEAIAIIRSFQRETLVTGDGYDRAVISAALSASFPTRAAAFPSAACVAEIGLSLFQRGDTVAPEVAVPTYLRPFIPPSHPADPNPEITVLGIAKPS